MSKIETFTITGSDAKHLAERDSLTLLSNEDGNYVVVTARGWWDGQRVSAASGDIVLGYNVSDYFTSSGMYLGPDDDGIEPTWDDAAN
jgi:hypothetical protein